MGDLLCVFTYFQRVILVKNMVQNYQIMGALAVHDSMILCRSREVHPLDPQPHRHSMLVPRVCAPRVTQCRLGKYWSRNFFQQAAGSQSWGTQVIFDSYSGRQRNLMMHAQCPLPVYYSQV